MVSIKVGVFGGMVPAVDDHLLPDTAAAHSENAWLYSGSLTGLPEPEVLHECVTTDTGKVFRLPADYARSPYLFGSYWMEFQDPNTDVIRAPVFGDTYDRYYWVSGGVSARYNTRARIENGDNPWLLGVPAGGSGITVTPSGGSGSDVVRAYVVTFVTAYGEEGPPNPPTVQTGKVDDTWALTNIPEPNADDLGDTNDNRYITKKRIYRTVTSNNGVATYFFVAEIDHDTTTYNDTALDEVVTANEQLQSTDWTGPPSDLEGFVAMPNGIIAGWRGNELWFSEPYRPHAWPVKYVQTVEYPIVGLGIVSQTLVVCTQGLPITASGVSPGSITTSKLTSFEPCISRGSILSAPEGVYFASPNGLILVSPGKIENITKNLVTKDRWQQLTKTSALHSARLGTAYYAYGSVRPGVFEGGVFQDDAFADEDFSGAYLGVLIDPFNDRVAYNVLTTDIPMFNVQNDPWSGELFRIRDNKVEWLNQSDDDVPIEAYIWKSKIFQLSMKENMSALRVFFENVDNLTSNLGTIKTYADGTLVATHNLVTSGELMRLPSGFKADFWQFEIEARVKVLSVQMASSVKELKAV